MLVKSSLFLYSKILTTSQVSIMLDFIQNLKFSVKIHFKPRWVPSSCNSISSFAKKPWKVFHSIHLFTFLATSAVRKSVGNAFYCNQETWISKILAESELNSKQTVKKLIFWEKAAVDKRA